MIDPITLVPERLRSILGKPGFALPDFSALRPMQDGYENCVFRSIEEGHEMTRQISFEPGAVRNVVVLGVGASQRGTIVVDGSDNLILVAGGAPNSHLDVYLREAVRCCAFVGQFSTCNHGAIFLQGKDNHVLIGEDCMFAHGITVRNSDEHGIIDLSNGNWINQPESVHIEPHVWLCPNVTVLKGSRIGLGSVVANGTLVNGEIARFSLAAGVPMKILRSNISWDRMITPRPEIRHHILHLGELVQNEPRVGASSDESP